MFLLQHSEVSEVSCFFIFVAISFLLQRRTNIISIVFDKGTDVKSGQTK